MGVTLSNIKKRLEEEGVKIRRAFKMQTAMAEAELFTYHDENSCSVCLDPLTDPVSLHCGHNFCLKCLTNLWDQSQVCSCPECGESFPTRPVLHINTVLNDTIKKLKMMAIGPPPSQNYAGPGDVECHVCPMKKFKAVKSCLTCMASFCQIHLKPHFEREAFKDHKLSDPDGNLQEKLCVIHQKYLEIFCKTDEMCICVMCVMTRHNGHEVVELKTKREEKQDEFTCSLCLETLSDPVLIPCGHNFCLKCLPDHWEQNQEFSCPQCREIFTTRPELHINTELNEDIKKIKKTPIGPPPSQNYAGPGDVECHVCPMKKFKAAKTCLTCMASFCQIHLKPHFERAALKGHKLSDPDGNLQEKLCVIHQKCLEIFCKTDEMCICVMCVMTRHKGHEVVELKTKREEKKQDEFTCSLCLEILSDPVLIPCGHNFCLKCLPDYWEQNQEFSCPQCREIFTTRPELHINTELNEDIKKIKMAIFSPLPSQNYAGSGDRAEESYLMCAVSYCQTPLKPHFEAGASKDDTLTDPVRNLKEKFCEEHQESLKMFCKTAEL